MGNQVALFNAPGPQGPPGAKGPKGDAGPAGPAGSALAVSGTGFVHWSGTGADAFARAVDLSGADVTGLLPAAKLAAGSPGQLLTTSGTTTIWATFSLSNIPGGTDGQVFVSSGTSPTWTSLISVEMTHGRLTAGGTGSDYKTVIGPLVGSETIYTAVYFLPNGVSASVSNAALYGDGQNQLVLNSGGASPTFFWQAAGSTLHTLTGGAFTLGSGSFTTPIIQGHTTVTSLSIGTNKAGSVLNINIDLNNLNTKFSQQTATINRIDFYSPNGTSQGSATMNNGFLFKLDSGASNMSLYATASSSGIDINTGLVYYTNLTHRITDWSTGTFGVTVTPNVSTTLLSASGVTSLTIGTNKTSAPLLFLTGAATPTAQLLYDGSVYHQFWLGAGTYTSTNFTLKADGTSVTVLNAPSGGTLAFWIAGSKYADLNTTAFTLGYNTATPIIRSDSSSTSLIVGTNKSAASLILQGDTATTILTLSTLAEFATSLLVDQVAAPAAPAAGKFSFYVDNSDGKLKAIAPSGNVTTLALP